MPAAISPTAASRCCSRASRSSFLISVTSWNVIRYPARPPGVSRCVALKPMSISRPSGRAMTELEAAGARAGQVPVQRVDQPRGQLHHLGDRPADHGRARQAADGFRGVVEREDPPRRSVVARPLGRLSMTCWLRACRSAISVDASSSRAPAERTLSASDPLSNATAKNPNTLSATMYCATERGGSVRDVHRQPGHVQQAGRGEVLSQHEAHVDTALSVATSRPPRRNRRAAADDRQHVERREHARDAAGQADKGRTR